MVQPKTVWLIFSIFSPYPTVPAAFLSLVHRDMLSTADPWRLNSLCHCAFVGGKAGSINKACKTIWYFVSEKMKDLYTVFFLSLVTFCMTRLFLGAYLENCMQDMCKRLTPLFFSYVWSWYLHGSYLFVHLNEVVKKKKKNEASNLECSLEFIDQLHLWSLMPEWLDEFLPAIHAAKQHCSIALWSSGLWIFKEVS